MDVFFHQLNKERTELHVERFFETNKRGRSIQKYFPYFPVL